MRQSLLLVIILQKRYEAYCKCSAPFISYFQKTKRLLRFDISTTTGTAKIIRTLNAALYSLGLQKKNSMVRAVLFAQSLSLVFLIARLTLLLAVHCYHLKFFSNF